MANQIGQFFISQPDTDASAAIANHLRKFWDPRMRSAIVDYVRGGGAGLNSAARAAIVLLGDDAR